jgi:hypothetical protein
MQQTHTPVNRYPMLKSEVERTGYYPAFVLDSIDGLLVGEDVVEYFIHLEATFDADELRRHVTVLLMTPTRLLVAHVDEFGPDETSRKPYAASTTEVVRLSKVETVVVARRVTDPDSYSTSKPLSELVVTIGWGAVSRLEMESADCGDPTCEADHGYMGTSSNDDLSIRVSAEADGPAVVAAALAFTSALSAAITPKD